LVEIYQHFGGTRVLHHLGCFCALKKEAGVSDKLPRNALQYFFIIHIELLHVSASIDHLQGDVYILQKHQTDMLPS
jgi:hypothetical protein